jgi:hypothetical protein
MGWFGKAASWVSKKVVAPAVDTVSPKAAQTIRQAKIEGSVDRWTADAAKQVKEGFSKDGAITSFVENYVPGGGFVTAIAHAAAGNEDYAQMAAVKGVSSGIRATAAVAGTVGGALIGGPGGAVLGGALGGAAGEAMVGAWEGGMRGVLEPSVRGKVDRFSWESYGTNVAAGAVVGGATGGLGYAAKAASKSSMAKSASSAWGRWFPKKTPVPKAPAAAAPWWSGSSRSFQRGVTTGTTRARSFSAPPIRPSRFQQARFRAGMWTSGKVNSARRGGAAVAAWGSGLFRRTAGARQVGGAIGKKFGKQVVSGVGGGILQETAAHPKVAAKIDTLVDKTSSGLKKAAAALGALALGIFGGLQIFGSGDQTTQAAPEATTTTVVATTLAPTVTTTTAPATTTTTQPVATTVAPPTLTVAFVVEVGNATAEDFTLLINGEPADWGGPGPVDPGSYALEVTTGYQSYQTSMECDGAAVAFGEALTLAAGEAQSCIVTTRYVPPETTTTSSTTSSTTTTVVVATTSDG